MFIDFQFTLKAQMGWWHRPIHDARNYTPHATIRAFNQAVTAGQTVPRLTLPQRIIILWELSWPINIWP